MLGLKHDICLFPKLADCVYKIGHIYVYIYLQFIYVYIYTHIHKYFKIYQPFRCILCNLQQILFWKMATVFQSILLKRYLPTFSTSINSHVFYEVQMHLLIGNYNTKFRVPTLCQVLCQAPCLCHYSGLAELQICSVDFIVQNTK